MTVSLIACGGSPKPAAEATGPAAGGPTESEVGPSQDGPGMTGAIAADPAATDDGRVAEPATRAEDDTACRDAARHVITIVKAGLEKMLEGMPPDQQAKAREEMDKELQEDLVAAECLKQGLTPAQLECIMAAKVMEDLAPCEER